MPSLLVFFWFRRYLHKEDALYKTNCNRMLTAGFLTIFPVMLLSVIMAVILNLSGLKTSQPLLYAALFTFGTYALSEELAKFYMFRRRLKSLDGEHSWLDLIVYSAIVGIGFGVLESIIFVVDSSPLEMLIRGICIPHGGYAALVGYFYGKSLRENKKGYTVLGVLIAFLIHGLYDFALTGELQAVSIDLAAAIAFPMAALEIIIIIVLIVFIRKHKNDPKYTQERPEV